MLSKEFFGDLLDLIAMSMLDYARNTNNFYFGGSTKNLDQYWLKSHASMLDALNCFKIISVDIFDTLLTRLILNPDDVFDVVGLILEPNVKNKIGNFRHTRKDAENKLRLKLNKASDVDIFSIYEEIKNDHWLTEDECASLLDLELKSGEDFI